MTKLGVDGLGPVDSELGTAMDRELLLSLSLSPSNFAVRVYCGVLKRTRGLEFVLVVSVRIGTWQDR